MIYGITHWSNYTTTLPAMRRCSHGFRISVFLVLCKVFCDRDIRVTKAESDCQVLVSEPWPTQHIRVPNGSDIEIICTSVKNSKSPIWSIDLAIVPGDGRYQFGGSRGQDLNANGVFDIETPGMPSTRRLLINNTAVNNQTVIYCDRLQFGTPSSATLFVFNPIPVTLGVQDDNVDSVKLTWSQESLVSDVKRALSLSISHGSIASSQEMISLNESYYYFTAPKGAPPCEVYNFSVTTTYVGAIYSGATYTDCSVASVVLSTMLPSLPNISQLESSLEYVLTTKTTGFAFYISFEPASYCKDYPIMNYTLEVNGIQNEEIRVSVFAPSAENFSIDGNLSENAVYSFRIHVANTVGVVSTSDKEFYTTDVQAVRATLIEGVNTSTILCEFIEDSNAIGCRVVLTTINGQKIYYNLKKNQSTNSTVMIVTVEHPPSCYSGVEAFDIECNGSVGSLAIPGHLVNPSPTPCTPATSPIKPSSPGTVLEIWMIAVISAVIVIIIVLLFAMIIVIVGSCKSKKMSKEEHLPDQLKDDAGESITAAEREMKTACSDMPTNCQLEESVALYSEIASTSKLGEHTTPGGGGGKSENVYSEPGSKGPHTKRGKASVPLEEKLYDQPVGAIERTSGDGADYSRTSQTSPVPIHDLTTTHHHGALYSTLDKTEDHIYFTLESDRPPHSIIPSPKCTSPQTPFIPDTQGPPPPATTSVSPPPVYQEITEISSRRGGSATRAVTANGDSNTPLSLASPDHIHKCCSVQGATDK